MKTILITVTALLIAFCNPVDSQMLRAQSERVYGLAGVNIWTELLEPVVLRLESTVPLSSEDWWQMVPDFWDSVARVVETRDLTDDELTDWCQRFPGTSARFDVFWFQSSALLLLTSSEFGSETFRQHATRCRREAVYRFANDPEAAIQYWKCFICLELSRIQMSKHLTPEDFRRVWVFDLGSRIAELKVNPLPDSDDNVLSEKEYWELAHLQMLGLIATSRFDLLSEMDRLSMNRESLKSISAEWCKWYKAQPLDAMFLDRKTWVWRVDPVACQLFEINRFVLKLCSLGGWLVKLPPPNPGELQYNCGTPDKVQVLSNWNVLDVGPKNEMEGHSERLFKVRQE